MCEASERENEYLIQIERSKKDDYHICTLSDQDVQLIKILNNAIALSGIRILLSRPVKTRLENSEILDCNEIDDFIQGRMKQIKDKANGEKPEPPQRETFVERMRKMEKYVMNEDPSKPPRLLTDQGPQYSKKDKSTYKLTIGRNASVSEMEAEFIKMQAYHDAHPHEEDGPYTPEMISYLCWGNR